MTQVRRILFHVSITHSLEDMGSLRPGLPAQKNYHERVLGRWARIEQRVRGLGLPWPEVKVYQDGLPDVSVEIIRSILAETHSPNFDLLRWLTGQGAQLVGSESPVLLREEYGLLRAVVTARDDADRASARQAYALRASSLLSERDAYIAGRIAGTLSSGEVGLLFIGQAHRVVEYLPPDIEVRELLHVSPS